MMGEGAASIARSNYKNTVREVKRLVGRSWTDVDLQADLKRLPFKCMWVSGGEKEAVDPFSSF